MADIDIASPIYHLTVGKYFQLAAYVMLVYDHLLTFSQEVERIWKQPMSVASILFLINRYGTPLEFLIVVTAFQAPHWTGETFVLFEGFGTVALVAVAQVIMILRVFALYGRDIRILIFLMALLAAQIIISAIGLKPGFPVPLPPGVPGCILTGNNTLFPSVWIAPLITDSIIFLLTIYRTKRYFRLSTGDTSLRHKGAIGLVSRGTSKAIMILVRDGALYFLLIFLANLMNALIYFTAEPDLKAVGASFSQLITSLMISRLVLNLRSLSSGSPTEQQSQNLKYDQPPRQSASFLTKALGNLGGDVCHHSSQIENSSVIHITAEIHSEIPMEHVGRPRGHGIYYSTEETW